METFHRRAVKLPKGTRREHLTLRPQATFGSHGRAVVLKNGKEIGHFLLSGNAVTTIATPLIFKLTRWYYPARRDGGRCCPNKQRFASADEQSLSDFTCTVHHRHLFLALKSPAAGSAEKPVRKGGAKVGRLWQRLSWMYKLMVVLVRICGSLACIREPAVGNWNTLDGLWGCPSGSKTWADWKKMPIFYFLYDWLLGLLEDALSPVERPHSVTITAAWQHLLCVVILGSGIFLVAAFRLTWLLLVYCYKDPVTPAGQSGGLFKKTGESGDLTRSPATPNHSLQYPADGSRPPSAAFKELGEKTSHEGKASGGVTFAEAKHKGIAAGHDVHFQKQPHNVGPNTPHKSGKHTAPDHVTATPADTLKGHPSPLPHPHTESTTPEMTDTPEDASPSVSPETPDNAPPSQLPETLEDAPPPDVADTPEDTARKARLAEMRKALEEAGVETVSRADAHTVSLQADNKRLRLLLASASAQLAAAQQGSGYFRRLFLSAAGLAKSAFQQAAAERHRAEAALERLHRVQAQADQTASNAAQQEAALTRLKLTAEARVSELTADIKLLRAALEQTALVRDRREAAFVQATKMRSSTEHHLVKTRLQRDALWLALQQYEDKEDAGSSAVPVGQSAPTSTSAASSATAEESKTPVHGSTVTQRATAADAPATASGSAAVQIPATAGESRLAPTFPQDVTAEAGHATAQGSGVAHDRVSVSEPTVAQDTFTAVVSTATAEASTSEHASTTAKDYMIAPQQFGAINSATAAQVFATAGESCLATAQSLATAGESDLGAAQGSTTAAGSLSTAASHAAAEGSNAPDLVPAQESRLTESSAFAEDSATDDQSNIGADIHATGTTITAYENVTSAKLHQSTNQAQSHNMIQTYTLAQTHDQNQTHAQAQNLSLSDSHHVLGSSAALVKTGAYTDPQTDQPQIAALHAPDDVRLQHLQSDLDSKDQVIMQQAAEITNHALKASAQTLKLQQLQTQLRARELAWLLFDIRLVPTRGFKNGQYDMPYNAKLIDEGGSAHIYLETLHGEQRATKYSKKGAKAAGGSAHELRMHLRCAGPNTVKILSVGMDKVPRGPVLSANVVCFSMEVASQSLKAYIGQASGGFKGSNRDGLVFELAHTKSIMRQVVQAMQGVHDHATLHGDVKPDNFLVFMHKDSAQLESVKITDFGLARDLIEGCHHITPTTDGTRGTQGWIAPELYAQNLSPEQRKGCNVTAKADVYAAGWVFFEVLCGLSPLLFH
ncbi:TPA: hypothetical protein ACH3X2_010618 [Trebouxia sp. C0005]